MKKKRMFLLSAGVLLAIAILAIAWYFLPAGRGGAGGSVAVPLDGLFMDGEYRFCGLEWGASLQDVGSALPYKLLKSQSGQGGPSAYIADASFELGGSPAASVYEFREGGLTMVRFDFHLGEDYEKWFEAQVQELASLYGQETDRMEGSSGAFASRGYRWDTEKTTLQIVLMTGDKINPSGMLGIGIK